MLANYGGSTLFVSHNLEEAYRVCGELVVLSGGRTAAQGPKEEIFRHPPTLDVARLTGCKNFSRARRAADGSIEALDWGCRLRVSQPFAKQPAHVAIRAHHVRVRPAGESTGERRGNVFPCRLVAMTETPFRVTLDLRLIGNMEGYSEAAPANAPDYQLQAEVFKQQWEAFRDLPQPWLVELAPELVFLLAD
jgi:molybdate transport system permease protein